MLADGMGGHRGGEVAAALAVSTTLARFNGSSRIGLVRAVVAANQAIMERSLVDENLLGMGTTICAIAAVVGESGLDGLAVVNVGDSRVYHYSSGGLIQVTEDHSLVADLVRAGDLTAEEAARHPQRNILTRALGIEDDPVVDTWELLPVVGDRYLLCSDGLFNELTDDRITEILGQYTDPGMAANELVDRAVDAGGHDNVTVLVVDVTEAPETGGEDWILPGVRPEQASASDMIGLGGQGWRPVALGVGLMGLLAAVFAGIGLYARSGWYVGEHNGGVAVFKGRPSGVLWFNPTVEEVMGLSILDLPEPQRKAVVDVIVVASLSEGRDLVERLSSAGD
ncbi:MAG: protein phosphatase 2C domain-containing protein [Acidimicrobiales bacterium]|nr:protein phosphatase 2C domain-containing protein [Acidimicrobiales bacterium]